MLVMANNKCIFRFVLSTQTISVMITFTEKFEYQPHSFIIVPESDYFLVVTKRRAKLINQANAKEYNLHTMYSIDMLMAAAFDEDDRTIYLVANKQMDLLGFYLLKFSPKEPEKFKNITEWRHKLDIGDVSLNIKRGVDPVVGHYKELIIGFKVIYMNTYTVHIEDLSGPEADRGILLRHEGYHLWEEEVTGMTIGSEYYMQLTSDGLKVLVIGSQEKASFEDTHNKTHVIHSLERFSYLKLSPDNFIFYDCESPKHRKICVMQEWDQPGIQGSDTVVSQTMLDPVYKVLLNWPELTDLIKMQSYYYGCTEPFELIALIRRQPNKSAFFLSLLEFNGSNFLPFIVADSFCLKEILGGFENEQGSMFPMIYKSQVNIDTTTYTVSPVDIAFKKNQNISIQRMIDFAVQH